MNYKFLDLNGLGSLIEKLKTIFASSTQGNHADSAYQHSLLKSGNPHNVTKSQIGLSNVENKSGATIRSEMTKEEVVDALGYTPPTANTNTTYTLTKSGSTITLTGSDGKKTSVTDSDTKYTLRSFGINSTATELNYLDGVTSNIQTQLNGKAPTSHNHSASNITSGTLPIARGGTGGTSASTARANIDAINILVQDSQPTSQNVGDFWLEII